MAELPLVWRVAEKVRAGLPPGRAGLSPLRSKPALALPSPARVTGILTPPKFMADRMLRMAAPDVRTPARHFPVNLFSFRGAKVFRRSDDGSNN